MNQKKIWNEIAPTWNKYRSKTPKIVGEFLKDKKGKVLDVGCGSGRNFVVQECLEFYGIDFSEEMIELAKEKAEKLRMKAELKVGEADKLSFKDNFFDYVICFAVINCILTKEKRKNILEEIYRVLKKGGNVLISSWGRHSERLNNKEKECFISWKVSKDKKVARYTYIYDLEELENEAKKIGFKIIRAWEDENVNLILER